MNRQYKLISKIISQNKILFLIFFFISIIQAGLALLAPYFSKLQVDQLENRHEDLIGMFYSNPEIIFALIVLSAVLVNLLEKMFDSVSDIYGKKIDYDCSVRLEEELYDRIERFDAGFMQNPRNRRIVNSSMDVTYLVGRLLSFASRQIGIMAAVFGILPIAAHFSPSIFLVLLFSGIVQIIIINSRTKKDIMLNIIKERKLSRFWELQNLIFYELHNISNVDDSSFVMKKYWELRKTRYDLEKKESKIYGKYSIIESLVQNFAYIFTALFAGFHVTNGNITIGSFIMLILYTSILQGVFQDITSAIPDFNGILIKFHKLEFFISLKPRLKVDKIKNINRSISGNIIFENVDFSYPNFYKEEREYIKSIIRKEENLQKKSSFMWELGDLAAWKEIISKKGGRMPLVLKSIDLEFKKGEITALVGRNGSGKTTLTNLIVRNYDPKKGKIKIGNHDLLNIKPKHLKNFVSMIPQEPFLLESFSVRENISFGRFDEDMDKKIWGILEILGFKKDIEELPKKLDSIIGDDVRFSGGQSQLLSIARVLIQNRPIIIFDEGTNQLDAEHEAKITDILKGLKKDKTIIMITHRMTTARKADKIYVMDEGVIIERGNHDELIEKPQGIYKKFWNLQVAD